jgi:hypothetical protein|tara:strand:- start:991 stop:1131 length:141 start_codon:yes stop_codon:yes gene_type:complete
MSKKTKVYKKEFQLLAECDTQKEAIALVKELKVKEGITTHKDFKIV